MDISPSLLKLEFQSVWREKEKEARLKSEGEKSMYIYSSVNETKLANVDGIGPLKLVPRIRLQGSKACIKH